MLKTRKMYNHTPKTLSVRENRLQEGQQNSNFPASKAKVT